MQASDLRTEITPLCTLAFMLLFHELRHQPSRQRQDDFRKQDNKNQNPKSVKRPFATAVVRPWRFLRRVT
jgi:hypothetical protein